MDSKNRYEYDIKTRSNIIKKLFETQLFDPIKEFATKNSYDIWAEVVNLAVRRHRTVDVVLKDKKLNYWAIELKTSLNLDVMAQAKRNLDYFNISCVATPAIKNFSSGRELAYEILKLFGIGLIEIYQDGKGGLMIPHDQPFTIEPEINPDRPTEDRRNVENWLFDEQRHSIGGVSTQAGFTKKKQALEKIRKYLKINGVATVDDLYEITKDYFPSGKEMFKVIRLYGEKFCKITIDEGVTFFEYTE